MPSKEEMLNTIMKFQENGQDEKAIQACHRLLKMDPGFAQGYFHRGLSYYNLQKSENAVDDFEHVLELKPDYFGLRHWLARALDAIGRHAEAAELKLAELRANPIQFQGMGVSPTDWVECAQFFLRTGQPDRAVATLKEYFRDQASNVTTAYADASTEPLRLYSTLMLEQGNLEAATTAAQLALNNPYCCPADPFLWIQILAAQGNVDEALAAYDRFFPEGAWWEEAVTMKDNLLARKNSGSTL